MAPRLVMRPDGSGNAIRIGPKLGSLEGVNRGTPILILSDRELAGVRKKLERESGSGIYSDGEKRGLRELMGKYSASEPGVYKLIEWVRRSCTPVYIFDSFVDARLEHNPGEPWGLARVMLNRRDDAIRNREITSGGQLLDLPFEIMSSIKYPRIFLPFNS